MSYFLSILIGIVGIAMVFALRAYARGRARAGWEYKKASSAFFDSARPLLADDQTPDEIVEVVRTLNATITNSSIAKVLAYYPMHANWSGKGQRLFKVAEEFFHERPELEGSFKKMFANWFIAVTALAPISGPAARYSLTNKDSMQAAALKASRKKAHRHGGNGPSKPQSNGIAHAH